MINEMKTKIDSTKKFVVHNKTKIAIASSFIAGGASVVVLVKKFESDNTKLVITPEQLLHMRVGGSMHYYSEFGEIVARFVETLPTPE